VKILKKLKPINFGLFNILGFLKNLKDLKPTNLLLSAMRPSLLALCLAIGGDKAGLI